MTILTKTTYRVQCQDCKMTTVPADNENDARKEAEHLGWYVGIFMHLCPTCLAASIKAEEARKRAGESIVL